MITITENAKKRIETILKTAPDGQYFRVGIRAGGCAGFEYTFSLDEVKENDDILETGIIVDNRALPLLEGSTVDFIEDISKSEFVVDNPNFSHGCGCGKSVG